MTDTAITVIVNHLKILTHDLEDRNNFPMLDHLMFQCNTKKSSLKFKTMLQLKLYLILADGPGIARSHKKK